MTTNAACLVFVLAACAAVESDAPTSLASDPCRLVTRRCSRCHPIERVFATAETDPTTWRSYVRRMRLMPGSGIAEDEESEITRCLVGWSTR